MLTHYNLDLIDMLPRLYVSAGVETPGSADAPDFTPIGMPANLRYPPQDAIKSDPEFLALLTETMAKPPAEVRQFSEKWNISKCDLGELKTRKVTVPLPEPEFLAIFAATNQFEAGDLKIPKSLAKAIEKQARAAYTGGLRAAGVAGTIGLLVSHLKCLVDSNAGGRHLSALESIGLSDVLFDDFKNTRLGAALVDELTQVGALLKLLNDDLAKDLGGVAVTSSQARRLIWLHACDVESAKVIRQWSSSPSPLGQPGLFTATKEKLQSLKGTQERTLALSLEMSRAGASGLAPVRTIPDVTTSRPTGLAQKKKQKPKRPKPGKQTSTSEPPAKTGKTAPGGKKATKSC